MSFRKNTAEVFEVIRNIADAKTAKRIPWLGTQSEAPGVEAERGEAAEASSGPRAVESSGTPQPGGPAPLEATPLFPAARVPTARWSRSPVAAAEPSAWLRRGEGTGGAPGRGAPPLEPAGWGRGPQTQKSPPQPLAPLRGRSGDRYDRPRSEEFVRYRALEPAPPGRAEWLDPPAPRLPVEARDETILDASARDRDAQARSPGWRRMDRGFLARPEAVVPSPLDQERAELLERAALLGPLAGPPPGLSAPESLLEAYDSAAGERPYRRALADAFPAERVLSPSPLAPGAATGDVDRELRALGPEEPRRQRPAGRSRRPGGAGRSAGGPAVPPPARGARPAAAAARDAARPPWESPLPQSAPGPEPSGPSGRLGGEGLGGGASADDEQADAAGSRAFPPQELDPVSAGMPCPEPPSGDPSAAPSPADEVADEMADVWPEGRTAPRWGAEDRLSPEGRPFGAPQAEELVADVPPPGRPPRWRPTAAGLFSWLDRSIQVKISTLLAFSMAGVTATAIVLMELRAPGPVDPYFRSRTLQDSGAGQTLPEGATPVRADPGASNGPGDARAMPPSWPALPASPPASLAPSPSVPNSDPAPRVGAAARPGGALLGPAHGAVSSPYPGAASAGIAQPFAGAEPATPPAPAGVTATEVAFTAGNPPELVRPLASRPAGTPEAAGRSPEGAAAASAVQAAPPPDVAPNVYLLQVRARESMEGAQKILAYLSDFGFRDSLIDRDPRGAIGAGKERLYTVFVGRYYDRNEARAECERLKRETRLRPYKGQDDYFEQSLIITRSR